MAEISWRNLFPCLSETYTVILLFIRKFKAKREKIVKAAISAILKNNSISCFQFFYWTNGYISNNLKLLWCNRPVGRAVTRSSLEREVRGSNLGPVKSDTVLPTARHHCDISSKGAVLPGRNDTEMSPANSLHASAYYSENNERFDLKLLWSLTGSLLDLLKISVALKRIVEKSIRPVFVSLVSRINAIINELEKMRSF